MSSRPNFEIANPELPRLLKDLPRELNVLDVACGSGVHGAELKRLYGHRVAGVDLSAASIEKAKTRLAEAYVADITHPERYPKLGRAKFDIIVFSNILEHVSNPKEVLDRHLPLLAPGGHILISLPNIAIWNVRLAMLFGRFEYQDAGTHDRTPMRFFTRRSFGQFLSEAGFTVKAQCITPGILWPFVPDSATYRFYMRWLYPVELAVCRLWPGMFAFQLVALVHPNSKPASQDPGVAALAAAVETRTEQQDVYC
jgi:SAM-dependent methyltransferase